MGAISLPRLVTAFQRAGSRVIYPVYSVVVGQPHLIGTFSCIISRRDRGPRDLLGRVHP